MELLTPEDIKKDKAEGATETARRINATAIQESKLLKELNILRVECEKQKQEILETTNEFVRIQKEKRELAVKEVTELEQRRQEALKREEAGKTNAEASARLEKVKEAEMSVQAQKDAINEELDDLAHLKDELNAREEKLEGQEIRKMAEDNRQKASRDLLIGNWIEYHDKTNKFNEQAKLREQKITADERANKIFKEELEEKGFLERERQIQDRYFTLKRAVDENNKKHNLNQTI